MGYANVGRPQFGRVCAERSRRRLSPPVTRCQASSRSRRSQCRTRQRVIRRRHAFGFGSASSGHVRRAALAVPSSYDVLICELSSAWASPSGCRSRLWPSPQRSRMAQGRRSFCADRGHSTPGTLISSANYWVAGGRAPKAADGIWLCAKSVPTRGSKSVKRQPMRCVRPIQKAPFLTQQAALLRAVAEIVQCGEPILSATCERPTVVVSQVALLRRVSHWRCKAPGCSRTDNHPRPSAGGDPRWWAHLVGAPGVDPHKH